MDVCAQHALLEKRVTDNTEDINRLGTKYNNDMNGNGKPGIKTSITVIKWQMGALIGMNIAIIGFLIKMVYLK